MSNVSLFGNFGPAGAGTKLEKQEGNTASRCYKPLLLREPFVFGLSE